MNSDTIFIQIASYRDPELPKTIDSLISNAENPHLLRFGICRQYKPSEDRDDLEAWREDPRFKILDVPFNVTKGACWARNLIQTNLYDGETYTLQIDSHMRAAHGWDQDCIAMYEALRAQGNTKPVLTTYVPSYDAKNDPVGRVLVPWRMDFDKFTPEAGVVLFLPADIPNHKTLEKPIQARFYSAHFCFAPGSFCVEVRHDPELYFHGEEISIAARAFTHGYDLFHPHKVVMWHEYTRVGRVKHWDDDPMWKVKNNKSFERYKTLVLSPNREINDPYGLGQHRTLRQYEEYAGISFSLKAVHPYTLSKADPPGPSIASYGSEQAWLASFAKQYTVEFSFSKASLKPNNDKEDEWDFWAVAINDAGNNEIVRKDADKTEINRLFSVTGDVIYITREFIASSPPVQWVVWPHQANGQWGERMIGTLSRVLLTNGDC